MSPMSTMPTPPQGNALFLMHLRRFSSSDNTSGVTIDTSSITMMAQSSGKLSCTLLFAVAVIGLTFFVLSPMTIAPPLLIVRAPGGSTDAAAPVDAKNTTDSGGNVSTSWDVR